MKKKLIDFTKVAYRNTNATEMRMRHNRGAHFKTGGKEPEGDDDDEDEDDGKKEVLLLKKIEKRITKHLSGTATKEEVQKLMEGLRKMNTVVDEKTGKEVEMPLPLDSLRQLADEKDGVLPKIIEMGTRMKNLEAKINAEVKSMSVREQVAKWHEDNKEALIQIKEGKKGVSLTTMSIRTVASPMLVSTVNSGSSPYIGRVEIESGINDIRVYANAFWDFIGKGRSSAPTYVWVNKTTRDGAADFIAPGALKPGVSFTLTAETSNAKKVAVSAKAAMELLQDIDGMTDMVEGELKYQLYTHLNDQLTLNAGSSTDPKGVRNYSKDVTFYTLAFGPTGIKTTNPNYMDAVRAVIGALASGKIKGEKTVFLNSIDITNMELAKAVNSGVYLLPPFISIDGRTISGAKIIEDNNVPVGSIQAGMYQYYRVLIYKDYTVDWGWENDDFTRNLVTAIAEMRLHQFVNSRDDGAFFYDTFQNVIDIITKA